MCIAYQINFLHAPLTHFPSNVNKNRVLLPHILHSKECSEGNKQIFVRNVKFMFYK